MRVSSILETVHSLKDYVRVVQVLQFMIGFVISCSQLLCSFNLFDSHVIKIFYCKLAPLSTPVLSILHLSAASICKDKIVGYNFYTNLHCILCFVAQNSMNCIYFNSFFT